MRTSGFTSTIISMIPQFTRLLAGEARDNRAMPSIGKNFLVVLSYPSFYSADLHWIENIRRGADPNYSKVQAHFTLVFPTNHLAEPDMVDHVRSRLTEVSQIEVLLGGAAVSDAPVEGRTYVFLVPVVGRDEIADLHDSLYTGVLESELRTDLPYTPHITVGSFEERDDAERLTDSLNAQRKHITGLLTEVVVLKGTDDVVEAIKVIPMGQSSD